MATQLAHKPEQPERETVETARPTVIGWQGIRCVLPPDWNITGFSMDRESGSLRVDAPANSSLSVQIRWHNAALPDQGPPTAYTFLAYKVREVLKRPAPPAPAIDLKANLERILKETAKQTKKGKGAFDYTLKPEKTEGDTDERSAIAFSWTGVGRGQGKIWRCSVCNRVVVAQVIGTSKDATQIGVIASQLFATLHDHGQDGYDLWALYDLETEVPDDFRLEEQKLLSGHLHLVWGRGGEKIVLDRWGLANMALKRFTLDEWFRNTARIATGGLTHDGDTLAQGHETTHYTGGLGALSRLRLLREAKNGLRNFPTRYEGGAWVCDETNKIFSVQTLHSKRTENLWRDIVARVRCHNDDNQSVDDSAVPPLL